MHRYLLALCLVGEASLASAEPILIEVAREEPRSTTLVDSVHRVVRGGTLHGAALSAAIAERVSMPSPESDRSGFDDLQTLVETGITDFYQNRFQDAIDKLTRASTALRAAIDVVGREERAAQSLFESQIILAITLRHEQHLDQAREIIRHCIRTFPDRRPMLAQFSPDTIHLFDEVKAGMDAAPIAQLRVTTEPVACIVLRDGQSVGMSPWEGGAYPGAHTLQVRCGGRLSGVRRLTLAEGPRHVHFDFEADAALHGSAIPWIQAGPTARRAAAALAAELGRQEVILVQERGGRVVIETVRAGSPRLASRGEGADAAMAWASLRAGTPESPSHPRAGGTAATTWHRDVGAWVGLGVGIASAVSGLVLVGQAREDASAAYAIDAREDPQGRVELTASARDAGFPGVLLTTAGTGLALGGLAALATPSSNRSDTFHGPLFWVLSAAGVLMAGSGVGLMLLDECDYDSHSFCPAVLDEPLDSTAPAGLVLTATGLVTLATAVVLRLTSEGGREAAPSRDEEATARSPETTP